MPLRLTAALAATVILAPGVAFARPTIALTMTGSTVVRSADGHEASMPLASGVSLRPGTVVRYAIDAANVGAEAARDLRPQARVPFGTVLLAASPSAPTGASVEYSVDGGKSWAAHRPSSCATRRATHRRSPRRPIATRRSAGSHRLRSRTARTNASVMK